MAEKDIEIAIKLKDEVTNQVAAVARNLQTAADIGADIAQTQESAGALAEQIAEVNSRQAEATNQIANAQETIADATEAAGSKQLNAINAASEAALKALDNELNAIKRNNESRQQVNKTAQQPSQDPEVAKFIENERRIQEQRLKFIEERRKAKAAAQQEESNQSRKAVNDEVAGIERVKQAREQANKAAQNNRTSKANQPTTANTEALEFLKREMDIERRRLIVIKERAEAIAKARGKESSAAKAAQQDALNAEKSFQDKRVKASQTANNLIGADLDGLSKKFATAGESLKASGLTSFGSILQNQSTGIAAAGAAITGIAAAGAAAVGTIVSLTEAYKNLAGNSIQLGQALINLQKGANVSAESAALFTQALGGGIDGAKEAADLFNQVGGILSQALADPAAEAARNIESLGISLRKANGDFINTEELVNQLGIRFQETQNKSQFLGTLGQVLGEGLAKKLTPTLGKLDELRRQAEQAGLVIKGPVAESITEASTRLARIGAMADGLFQQIGVKILPSVNNLLGVTADRLAQFANSAEGQTGIQSLIDLFNQFGEFLQSDILPIAEDLLRTTVNFITTVKDTKDSIDGLINSAREFVFGAGGDLIKLLKGVEKNQASNALDKFADATAGAMDSTAGLRAEVAAAVESIKQQNSAIDKAINLARAQDGAFKALQMTQAALLAFEQENLQRRLSALDVFLDGSIKREEEVINERFRLQKAGIERERETLNAQLELAGKNQQRLQEIRTKFNALGNKEFDLQIERQRALESLRLKAIEAAGQQELGIIKDRELAILRLRQGQLITESELQDRLLILSRDRAEAEIRIEEDKLAEIKKQRGLEAPEVEAQRQKVLDARARGIQAEINLVKAGVEKIIAAKDKESAMAELFAKMRVQLASDEIAEIRELVESGRRTKEEVEIKLTQAIIREIQVRANAEKESIRNSIDAINLKLNNAKSLALTDKDLADLTQRRAELEFQLVNVIKQSDREIRAARLSQAADLMKQIDLVTAQNQAVENLAGTIESVSITSAKGAKQLAESLAGIIELTNQSVNFNPLKDFKPEDIEEATKQIGILKDKLDEINTEILNGKLDSGPLNIAAALVEQELDSLRQRVLIANAKAFEAATQQKVKATADANLKIAENTAESLRKEEELIAASQQRIKDIRRQAIEAIKKLQEQFAEEEKQAKERLAELEKQRNDETVRAERDNLRARLLSLAQFQTLMAQMLAQNQQQEIDDDLSAEFQKADIRRQLIEAEANLRGAKTKEAAAQAKQQIEALKRNLAGIEVKDTGRENADKARDAALSDARAKLAKELEAAQTEEERTAAQQRFDIAEKAINDRFKQEIEFQEKLLEAQKLGDEKLIQAVIDANNKKKALIDQREKQERDAAEETLRLKKLFLEQDAAEKETKFQEEINKEKERAEKRRKQLEDDIKAQQMVRDQAIEEERRALQKQRDELATALASFINDQARQLDLAGVGIESFAQRILSAFNILPDKIKQITDGIKDINQATADIQNRANQASNGSGSTTTSNSNSGSGSSNASSGQNNFSSQGTGNDNNLSIDNKQVSGRTNAANKINPDQNKNQPPISQPGAIPNTVINLSLAAINVNLKIESSVASNDIAGLVASQVRAAIAQVASELPKLVNQTINNKEKKQRQDIAGQQFGRNRGLDRI